MDTFLNYEDEDINELALIKESEQKARHQDEAHTQQMRHADELHQQTMKHRDEAHQHNLEHAKKHKKTLAASYLYGGFAFNSPPDNDADDEPDGDENTAAGGGAV